jgi:sulfite dehydrogenase
LGKHAWRCFQFKTDFPEDIPAMYTRATDTNGDTQPKVRVENERGYGNNSWLDHGYQMVQNESTGEVTVANNDIDSQTAAEGKEVFLNGSPPCGACHTLEDAQTAGLVGPNLDQLNPDAARVERAVRNGVGSMPGYGETLSDSEIKAVAEYVAHASKK